MQVSLERRSGRRSALIDWVVRVVFVGGVAIAQVGLAALSVPIEGKLTPEGVTATVSTTVTFRLEFWTTASFAKGVAVHLKVPDGMSLVEGAADVEMPDLAIGQKCVLEYRLRLDRPGEKKVWVDADVLGIAPAVMSKGFLSVVNPEGDGTSNATIRRDRDGTSHQVKGIPCKQSP